MEDNDISEINVSAVKRMAESIGWQELSRELNLMIEDLRDILEDKDDDKARGSIRALRTILAWPESVLSFSTSENDYAPESND